MQPFFPPPSTPPPANAPWCYRKLNGLIRKVYLMLQYEVCYFRLNLFYWNFLQTSYHVFAFKQVLLVLRTTWIAYKCTNANILILVYLSKKTNSHTHCTFQIHIQIWWIATDLKNTWRLLRQCSIQIEKLKSIYILVYK